VAGEATSLDPTYAQIELNWELIRRVYETLITIADDGSFAPLLATSWEQPTDTSYVFHIRQGVKFSNGREMTADDVAASLTRATDPKQGTDLYSDIDKVVKVDPSTIRIDLKRPSGVLLTALAQSYASILPSVELAAGTYDPTKDMLGTGPFIVKDHKQDESWTLARNPYYWREGRPYADEVKVQILTDPSARVAALKGGTADISLFEDPDTQSLFAGDPNVVVVPQQTTNWYYLQFNGVSPLEPKLKDARVRQALAMALNRQQIVSLAAGGLGEPLVGAPTLSKLADACDTSQLNPENPDQAKSILQTAGALPLTLTMDTTSIYPVMASMNQVIQQQWSAVGVTLDIKQVDVGVWVDDNFVKGNADAVISFNTALTDNWFAVGSSTLGGTPWKSALLPATPSLDAQLVQTRGMAPGPDRAAIFQDMCKEIANEAFDIPLATRTTFVAYRKDRIAPVIQGFEPINDYLRNFGDFAVQ